MVRRARETLARTGTSPADKYRGGGRDVSLGLSGGLIGTNPVPKPVELCPDRVRIPARAVSARGLSARCSTEGIVLLFGRGASGPVRRAVKVLQKNGVFMDYVQRG